ncbi:GNAT family N-acetyltransferase [Sphingomonas lacunae]|uniref:GNAT family N-acetyltransferase n=1 Tax=Sphingomonas lacunae TaxID=2698828 RepID=A0A6M4AW21_9SPHN|nr:GNAT family N-acetyltransferase [Sphingomonas lacunae]QJQ32502.1 GNAT family N-acetyltransferase [Sphingomonas lacunae]
MLPTLIASRLTLRPLRDEDSAALHPVFADPAVMQWWSHGPHQSPEKTREVVALNALQEPGYACWAITLDGGAAHGWVTLKDRRPGVSEIGYLIGRSLWGQGYGREAVTAVLDHGFACPGQRRVYADVDPENAPSIRLLERLGFVLEGHLREEWETHIGVRDTILYGLLAREWLGRAAQAG